MICGCALLCALQLSACRCRRAPRRPNIVLIFPDNLGWGEVGVYGSVRGVPTPRIDSIAAEGMRLNNFNVEFSCTVSRAALLTGRYAIRTGADADRRHHAVGSHDRRGAQAARLRDGAVRQVAPRRRPTGSTAATPTDQGFDEWYGIPNDEQRSADHDDAGLRPGDDGGAVHLGRQSRRAVAQGEGRSTSTRVARSIARRRSASIAFMERNVRATEAVLPLSIRSRRSTSPRSRIRTSRGRPAPATSATRWRTWTTTSASCSTRSSGSASSATRSCSGARTTAPRGGGRGAARRAVDAASTTR